MGSTQAIDSTSLRLRVHKLRPGSVQGPAIVMEVAQPSKQNDGEPSAKKAKCESWTFVRIASLRSGDKPWRMGPFSASPLEQKGGKTVFHKLNIGPKLDTAHSSDPGH